MLSAAQTPSGMPTIIVSTVATSTCESVSIACVHSFETPITVSIASVTNAGRRPEIRKATNARPSVIAGHGISTKKLRSGCRPYWTRKFPIGFVIWKMNVDGFCT